MHEDGFHHPAAERIRSCGHSSTDQHFANNFIKLLESCGLGALRDEIDGGTVTCIILPSKLLGWMFKQNRQKYYKAMCGGNVRKVAEFWAGLRNQPLGNMLFDLHPHLRGRSLESLTHTIPLLIHQDAGPYTVTRKSADLVFYSSLLALGSDLETHFLAFSELKCKGQPRDSCRGAWDVLMTDLNALVTSEAFVDNVNGRQIHWNFLLLLGTCDTEQGVFWGLSAYSSAGDDLMCGYCNANRTDRIFTDLRESSEWKRSERRSNNEFLVSNQGNHPMRYSRVWHKELCRLDLMHNLDHTVDHVKPCLNILA